jgi:hypothetical protein
MKSEPNVRYVVPENLTEEQIAEAKKSLHDIARLLGRVSAQVCHKMGIQFDMDDPEVAREVMRLTFEGVFYSAPPVRSTKKAARSGSRRTSAQA